MGRQLPRAEPQPVSPAHQQWDHAEPVVGTPLPGTPGGAAPPEHWEDAVAEWPALDTPAPAGFGPDAPAAATPPSARYTPGLAGMADGMMGFTPSPAGAGSAANGGGTIVGQPAWGSPAGWGSSPAPSSAGGTPAGAAPQQAAMAGGPQVPAGPKAAFASWAAAGAAQRAAGGSQPQRAAGAPAAAPSRSRQPK